MIGHLINILILFMLLSCSFVNENEEVDAHYIKIMEEVKRIRNIETPNNIVYQHLTCIHKNKKGGVLLKELFKDTLDLQVNFWSNCILEGGEVSSIKIVKDTIYLGVVNYNDVIVSIDEKGDFIYTSTLTDCDCLFQEKLKIIGVNEVPSVIVVNGVEPKFSHEKYHTDIK